MYRSRLYDRNRVWFYSRDTWVFIQSFSLLFSIYLDQTIRFNDMVGIFGHRNMEGYIVIMEPYMATYYCAQKWRRVRLYFSNVTVPISEPENTDCIVLRSVFLEREKHLTITQTLTRWYSSMQSFTYSVCVLFFPANVWESKENILITGMPVICPSRINVTNYHLFLFSGSYLVSLSLLRVYAQYILLSFLSSIWACIIHDADTI